VEVADSVTVTTSSSTSTSFEARKEVLVATAVVDVGGFEISFFAMEIGLPATMEGSLTSEDAVPLSSVTAGTG
jgi:hypothetical protein